MDEPTFRYLAACSSPGCTEPAGHKIAAPWSDGPLRELKSYGLACDRHLEALRIRAEEHRSALTVRDDELVGPVEVFPLPPRRVAPGP